MSIASLDYLWLVFHYKPGMAIIIREKIPSLPLLLSTTLICLSESKSLMQSPLGEKCHTHFTSWGGTMMSVVVLQDNRLRHKVLPLAPSCRQVAPLRILNVV